MIQDALEWQLDRWERFGTSPRNLFWLKLLSFPWLNRLAWGRLVEPYFE